MNIHDKLKINALKHLGAVETADAARDLNRHRRRIRAYRERLSKISAALIPEQIFTGPDHETEMILHAIRRLQGGK